MRKYFFKAATPELIHKRVGSLWGIKEAEGSIKCPLLLKNFNQVSRIWSLVMYFICPPEYKKAPYFRNEINPRYHPDSNKHLIKLIYALGAVFS